MTGQRVRPWKNAVRQWSEGKIQGIKRKEPATLAVTVGVADL